MGPEARSTPLRKVGTLDLRPITDEELFDRARRKKLADEQQDKEHRVRPAEKRAKGIQQSIYEELAMMVVSAELWQLAESLEDPIEGMPGRPCLSTIQDALVHERLRLHLKSSRKVDRELQRSDLWSRLGDDLERAWPEQKMWRLSLTPPTRDRASRLFKRYEIKASDFHERLENWSIGVAQVVGMFDKKKGSLTHPANENTLIGDATWIESSVKKTVTKIVDKTTGEVIEKETDEGTEPFNKTAERQGNYLLTTSVTDGKPRGTVMLSTRFVPLKSEKSEAVEDVLRLKCKVPAIRAHAYDSKLGAAEAAAEADVGVVLVNYPSLIKDSKPNSRSLGVHKFRHGKRQESFEVTAIHGSPYISIVIAGTRYRVPLKRIQNKLFTKNNRIIEWITCQIPASDGVPAEFIGLRTRIRLNSTKSEIKNGSRRTVSLRGIFDNDPDFDRIYGRRNTTESLHADIKRLLPESRFWVRGLERKTRVMHNYQVFNNLRCVVMACSNNDQVMQKYFGNWRPWNSKAQAA